MVRYPPAPINRFFSSDDHFNELYPASIQALSKRHWTPILVAKLATEFLTDRSNAKILDIGSGVGKFCLTGASFAPNAHFYGVEQRESLIGHALGAQQKLGVPNVTFINGNFTQLDFSDFNHFYFFNSFYENLDPLGRIDDKIDYSESLYEYYTQYLYNSFKDLPKGTKVVTYHVINDGLPDGYSLIHTLENYDLQFWMKK